MGCESMQESDIKALDALPFYRDKQGCMYPEIKADTKTNIVIGWPVFINSGRNGIMAEITSGDIVFYHKLRGEKKKYYRVQVKKDGLHIEVQNFKSWPVSMKTLDVIPFCVVREYVNYKNRHHHKIKLKDLATASGRQKTIRELR